MSSDSLDPVTFVFLHDPQPMTDDQYGRIARLNVLNSYLNSIDQVLWPAGNGITPEVQGQPVGKPAFIVFGGDLTQNGGYFNGFDQAMRNPSTYFSGEPLQQVRWMFDRNWKGLASSLEPHKYAKLTQTTVDNVYFGLGNHDLQTSYHPDIAWRGYNKLKGEGENTDYWRYQMWDFICQLHSTGLKAPDGKITPPDIPITGANTIDDGQSLSFDWKSHSFNYHLNFGYFSVFQLHCCGGDKRFGRESGLSWLTTQLNTLGTTHPVIIVQHWPFDQLNNAPSDTVWTQADATAFLEVIKQYNVVALLTGHWHDPLSTASRNVQIGDTGISFDQFRPGMCSCQGSDDPKNPGDPGGRFSVVRMSPTTFNIAHGMVPDSPNDSPWFDQYGKVIESNAT